MRFCSASVLRSSYGRIAPVNTTGAAGVPTSSTTRSPLTASRSVPWTTTTPAVARAIVATVSAMIE